MPEDTEAGQIQGFLEHYTGNVVCSKQLFKEALGHAFEEICIRDRYEKYGLTEEEIAFIESMIKPME